MELNNQIAELLTPHYIDYLGFADLGPYQGELTQAGGPIVDGYQSGISIGIALPNSIVDHLPQRHDINVSCEYRLHAYDIINERLNLVASMLASFLNGKGYRTLPIPAADHTEDGKSTVSHKMIAHIAGIGWIGKSCLLVTPDHGPRVRFISLLTDAPLKTVNNPIEQKCGGCTQCTQICPVGAIKGKNYAQGEARDERLYFDKCNSYFEQMKKDRPYAVCGMCLYACPNGRKPKAN
jgi:epoxyqueuosine reductase QueG